MPAIKTTDVSDAAPLNRPRVIMTRKGSSTRIVGEPAVLRKIVFWIGDVVYPDWPANPAGRKAYLGYADGCDDGVLDVLNKHFWDKARDRVKLHLLIDGVEVEEETAD